MSTETDKYTYRVTWSEEDTEFVGQCAEFHSLSWLDESPELALAGIRKLIADVVQDMDKSGEAAPLPLSKRKFSGKFMVRIPLAVHRHLAMEAAESGIRLNRLASAKLAQ